jgi:hypothetical protein
MSLLNERDPQGSSCHEEGVTGDARRQVSAKGFDFFVFDEQKKVQGEENGHLPPSLLRTLDCLGFIRRAIHVAQGGRVCIDQVAQHGSRNQNDDREDDVRLAAVEEEFEEELLDRVHGSPPKIPTMWFLSKHFETAGCFLSFMIWFPFLFGFN